MIAGAPILMALALASPETGKLADLVILDEDVLSVAPEKLEAIAVDVTIVGGRVVYSR